MNPGPLDISFLVAGAGQRASPFSAAAMLARPGGLRVALLRRTSDLRLFAKAKIRIRGSRHRITKKNTPSYDEAFFLVGLIEPNWNQIKRELITMWQIVNEVRKDTPVAVKRQSLNLAK